MKNILQKVLFILSLTAVIVWAVFSVISLPDNSSVTALEIDGLMRYTPKHGAKIVYGYSGRGRELKAWRFGKGDNVLVMTFCLHGYEDGFDRDGAALVYTANEIMEAIPRWECEEWSIYVLPCCNPDGLIEGTSNESFGRCVGSVYLENGSISFSTYADINRCFPVNWESLTEARFYNGTAPLACAESVALADFLKEVKGEEMNFCIDVHGWYQQTLTSSGNQSVMYKIFNTGFPENTWADVNRGTGYLAAYAAVLGYDSMLFEFPSGVNNMDDFENSGYAKTFIECVRMLVGG